MPTVKVYNQEGTEIGTRELPNELFGLKVKPALIHQVVTAQLANRRATTAHTKTRGEVSGGGRKPWKQKGTGRARAGSIRSPLWKGGGVTFGPRKSRNYREKIPQTMWRRAFWGVLSDRVAHDSLRLIDQITLSEAKTKAMVTFFAQHSRVDQRRHRFSLALVVPAKSESVVRSAKNIPGVTILNPQNLNVYDLVRARELLMTLPALEATIATYPLTRRQSHS